MAEVSARVRSWLNHARYGNTMGLRKAVLREATQMAALRAAARAPQPQTAAADRSPGARGIRA